jgi:predicted neutral ceramidase superfamily lipid hydrolase
MLLINVVYKLKGFMNIQYNYDEVNIMHKKVHQMIQISTILNIIVLIPVISVILLDLELVERAWGPNQASRQILVSIYIAILAASVALLFLKGHAKTSIAVTVFSMQIIYKTLTAIFVVNAFTNPVVLSNLAINIVHLTTLFVMFKHYPNLLNE